MTTHPRPWGHELTHLVGPTLAYGPGHCWLCGHTTTDTPTSTAFTIGERPYTGSHAAWCPEASTAPYTWGSPWP